MSLKSHINAELLLEGGKALKQTVGIKQKYVAALHAELLPKIAKALGLAPTMVAPIGSAGRKADPEALSGDVDIAVQTVDIDRVRHAIEQLGVDGICRSMSGINVYSFAAQQPDGLVQVDLMPVSDLRFAAWSFYSASDDLALGLKGSHRNELLFALAKHAALVYQPTAGVPDGERERYMLDLNHGLFKVRQTRIGKRGPVKSYTTIAKDHITADPDEICRLLFGYNVPASALLTFDSAWKALADVRFAFQGKRADVQAELMTGLNRKALSLPAQLRPLAL